MQVRCRMRVRTLRQKPKTLKVEALRSEAQPLSAIPVGNADARRNHFSGAHLGVAERRSSERTSSKQKELHIDQTEFL